MNRLTPVIPVIWTRNCADVFFSLSHWCPLRGITCRDMLGSLRTRCCCHTAAADSVSLNWFSIQHFQRIRPPSRHRRGTQMRKLSVVNSTLSPSCCWHFSSLWQQELKHWRCLLSACKTGRSDELMMRRKMSKGRRMRHSESNKEHVLLLRHWTSWDPVGFEIPAGILWDGSQFQYYNKTGTGQEKKMNQCWWEWGGWTHRPACRLHIGSGFICKYSVLICW